MYLKRILLLSFLVVSSAEAKTKKVVDYSRHNVSLYEQIKDRIRSKVSARLKAVPKSGLRYFLVPFAYQDAKNKAKQSHSFASIIRVGNNVPSEEVDTDYVDRKAKVEAFTISWLPHDFMEDPNLCVFKGFLAIIFAKNNECRPVVGKNHTLKETLDIALFPPTDPKQKLVRSVGMWGPYEISKEFFDKAVERRKFLRDGKIKYMADDRLTREDLTAFNCFHAIGDLQTGFPKGGFLGTGLKMWGLNGTKRNLIEYKAKASKWLLESVDEERDLYGFVYTTSKQNKKLVNPFARSSAFYK